MLIMKLLKNGGGHGSPCLMHRSIPKDKGKKVKLNE